MGARSSACVLFFGWVVLSLLGECGCTSSGFSQMIVVAVAVRCNHLLGVRLVRSPPNKLTAPRPPSDGAPRAGVLRDPFPRFFSRRYLIPRWATLVVPVVGSPAVLSAPIQAACSPGCLNGGTCVDSSCVCATGWGTCSLA